VEAIVRDFADGKPLPNMTGAHSSKRTQQQKPTEQLVSE